MEYPCIERLCKRTDIFRVKCRVGICEGSWHVIRHCVATNGFTKQMVLSADMYLDISSITKLVCSPCTTYLSSRPVSQNLSETKKQSLSWYCRVPVLHVSLLLTGLASSRDHNQLCLLITTFAFTVDRDGEVMGRVLPVSSL